jgi:hypothetical protein
LLRFRHVFPCIFVTHKHNFHEHAYIYNALTVKDNIYLAMSGMRGYIFAVSPFQ